MVPPTLTTCFHGFSSGVSKEQPEHKFKKGRNDDSLLCPWTRCALRFTTAAQSLATIQE